METEKNIIENANVYINEGLDAFSKNQLSEAASIVSKALQLLKGTNELKLYAKALNILGVIYATIGNETMAIDCYLDGLEIAEEHSAYDLLFLFYNNIGSRYQELGEHQKAIYYFQQSREQLKMPEVKSDMRYKHWCMISALNLVESYCMLMEYKEAEYYLKLADEVLEGEVKEDYMYTYLLSKFHLCLKTGKEEFVYSHLEELLECAAKDKNNMDFVQNMTEVSSILLQIKDFEHLREMVQTFDDYAKTQGTVFYRITAVRLWMKYYKAIGKEEEYKELCVEHAELMEQEEHLVNQEKIAAIDTKIELRVKEAERRKAEKEAMLDPLTGLWNRLKLRKDSVALFESAFEKGSQIALGVLDVDCFKAQNDTYGHLQGDSCLKEVTQIMRQAVGEQGTVYRYGGDEFIILLTDGKRSIVEKIADTIRKMLEEQKIPNDNSVVEKFLTVSQGYVSFVPKHGEELADYLRLADQELYQVKERGRNDYSIVVQSNS
ncbi:MAG: GGDEF domain-containing protein [Roseburia sp.]